MSSTHNFFVFWSMVCLQAFGGIIYDGNPRLPGSAIEENEYPNLLKMCVFPLQIVMH